MTHDIKALAFRLAQHFWPSDRRMWSADADLPRVERLVRAALAEGLRVGIAVIEENAWACHAESIMHKVLMSNAAALRAKADEMESQP